MDPAPIRMDGQGKYCLVARGEAALYYRRPPCAAYRERIWDHAPGALLVHETGGRVCDFSGRPLEFKPSSILSVDRGIVAIAAASNVQTLVLDYIKRGA